MPRTWCHEPLFRERCALKLAIGSETGARNLELATCIAWYAVTRLVAGLVGVLLWLHRTRTYSQRTVPDIVVLVLATDERFDKKALNKNITGLTKCRGDICKIRGEMCDWWTFSVKVGGNEHGKVSMFGRDGGTETVLLLTCVTDSSTWMI